MLFNDNLMIFQTEFGSKLYGLNTSKSDSDIVGVFVPSFKYCVTNNIPEVILNNTGNNNSKNKENDVDRTFYSLQRFLQLVREGQTCALDILFADSNPNVNIYKHPLWELLIKHRNNLISKNPKAFIGYCRKQANKYSNKGARIIVINNMIDYICNNFDLATDVKVSKIIESLIHNNITVLDNMKQVILTEYNQDVILFKEPVNKAYILQICGSKFEHNANASYVVDQLKNIIKQRGIRAKKAAENGGVDFKAVSHAFRVVFEIEQLLTTKQIVFPFTGEPYKIIMGLKTGEIPFDSSMEQFLSDKINYIDTLVEKSDLPDQVSNDLINQIIVDIYDQYAKQLNNKIFNSITLD